MCSSDLDAMIDYDQFLAVDMRVGRIVQVEDFPQARKPAWKLTIDFGEELGTKRSSAQVTNYAREELEGRLIVAVVNFPPRQIGPVRSEVLVLGASDEAGDVILLAPDAGVPLVDHAGCGPSTTTCDMRCSPPRTVRESCATRRAGGTPG